MWWMQFEHFGILTSQNKHCTHTEHTHYVELDLKHRTRCVLYVMYIINSLYVRGGGDLDLVKLEVDSE